MVRNCFFSIIIPTFNAEKTINECLLSICNQDFQDFEVWIIDALSKDHTLSIANSFTKDNIKIISEKDLGIYDAMNKGINLANGEFLYFMGSDDTFFNPKVLKEIHKAINLNTDQIIYGNVKMNGNNKWVKDGSVYGGAFDLKRVLSHNIPHQAIFYRRTVFSSLGGYNLHYPIFADHDFNIKAFSKYTFKYVEIIVANFQVGGASTNRSDKFQEDKAANIVRYFENFLMTRTFIPIRYYLRQTAFDANVKISLSKRIYYSLLYFRLKIQSLIE